MLKVRIFVFLEIGWWFNHTIQRCIVLNAGLPFMDISSLEYLTLFITQDINRIAMLANYILRDHRLSIPHVR